MSVLYLSSKYEGNGGCEVLHGFLGGRLKLVMRCIINI